MKRVFLILALSGVFFGSTKLQAQETSTGLAGFWEVTTPTGSFVARLDHITSVSLHEYFIAGSGKVFECTVDTSGGMVGRFYYLDPAGGAGGIVGVGTDAALNQLREFAGELAGKAGVGDPEHVVIKSYPTTTHAKTAEYRLKKKENIQKIYSHVRKVWAAQRGRGKENKLVISE